VRYLALAADYDNTLAWDGHIADMTAAVLERLRASGRRLILITGRRLDDLSRIKQRLFIFDYVVAENGALVLDPRTHAVIPLFSPPPQRFLERLKSRGITPLEIGEVIIATLENQKVAVLEVIQELGLELQLIFNRNALMILPAGANKATGLAFVLRKLGLSLHEVVGIGDAENDHSFLERCECAIAVANAVPSVREMAALVTQGENGEGVIEVVEKLISNDLKEVEKQLLHHQIPLGIQTDGTYAWIPQHGRNLMVVGPSGCGKSTFAAGLVERLIAQSYQVCIIDPEGDYGTLQGVIPLGGPQRPPSINEILAVLEDPQANLNINLLGIPVDDRPDFFTRLLSNLQAMRIRTGRPHWLLVDEAHHVLPAAWGHIGETFPQQLGKTFFITVHPDHIASQVLASVDIVIAVGWEPERSLQAFATAAGTTLSCLEFHHGGDKAVVWFVKKKKEPFPVTIIPGRLERLRHHRKYAEGDVRHHSFYFRGPRGKQNLRAQNLVIFSQIAEGIDEETWLFHLQRGDYSRWFREVIRDSYLATQAEQIEERKDLAPAETRHLIRHLIESRYTLPE
jgi:hydroxymethylpyrimidine pyrophosphatase-like HAD family hydrolase